MRDAEALELIAQAEKDLARIKALWKPARSYHHNRADRFGAGYPTGSGSAGVRGGTSDPIGELVERRSDRGFPSDPLGFRLDEALNDLRELPNLTNRLLTFVLQQTVASPIGQAPEDCKVCALAGFSAVVYAKGLCRWCWDKLQELGEEPHVELARVHHQGKRVTQNMVDHFHPREAMA